MDLRAIYTPLLDRALGPGSPLGGPWVRRGPTTRARIALTFDDGPSESTPAVLQALARHGVRATFFQLGTHVRRLPDVARAVHAAGHELGNHGDGHVNLAFRPRDVIAAEVARAQSAIEAATGATPRWFRPAYGFKWFGLARVLRRHGLKGVLWSTLASDWRSSADVVTDEVVSAAVPGAIVCLHDGRGLDTRPDLRTTLDAIDRVIPTLRARGFDFVTVGGLLAR